MAKKFGNSFEYDTMWIESDNHIVYTGVNIKMYIDWDRGDEIEAIFNAEDGTFFFQEWISKTHIWNKSPVFRV